MQSCGAVLCASFGAIMVGRAGIAGGAPGWYNPDRPDLDVVSTDMQSAVFGHCPRRRLHLITIPTMSDVERDDTETAARMQCRSATHAATCT